MVPFLERQPKNLFFLIKKKMNFLIIKISQNPQAPYTIKSNNPGFNCSHACRRLAKS